MRVAYCISFGGKFSGGGIVHDLATSDFFSGMNLQKGSTAYMNHDLQYVFFKCILAKMPDSFNHFLA